MKNNFKTIVSILLLGLVLASCTKENMENPEVFGELNEQQLQEEAERRFEFTPNQPFEAVYRCGRLNSQLSWYFWFREDNSLQVLFTTDTYEDYAFDGTYEYTNDEIRLMMPAGPQMPFPQGLDERTTVIMPQMGLVAAFATPEMVCLCQGHNLNEQAPPQVNANYDCPNINFEAVSDEDNAIEFQLRHVPFELPVPGSVFRHQETWVQGLTNPLIRRSTGIYRQYGNRFFANFRIAHDFARYAGDRLPVADWNPELPFDDYNMLSGEFLNNGQEVIIDQLKPEAGSCTLR